MRIFTGTILAFLGSLSALPATTAATWGFPYGSQKVRGVNLGGWLVLEPWITPSLFDNTGDSRIIDEWTFGQFQDEATATSVLQNHWNTWITEADFAAIAAAGYDNSGQKLSSPTWQTKQSNIDRSDAIIMRLASMFASNTGVVPIIAPLNEPAGYDGDQILSVTRQYWYDSYGNIRFPFGTSQQSNLVVLIHDAFQPLSYWDGFMPPPNWQGVMIDTHIYQMFSQSLVSQTNAQHISTACGQLSSLSNSPLWTVVGEWTPAPNDCAKYLNGRGTGSRYEGTLPGSTRVGSCTGLTGKASSFSSSYKTFLRQYWEAQAQTFEKGNQGWIQWTWKAENADEWTYQAGLANDFRTSDMTKTLQNSCEFKTHIFIITVATMSTPFFRQITVVTFCLSLLPSIYALAFGFPYGSQKVRGVNLGGWLVLEPWITPSLFDDTGDPRIVDEYTFGQYQDHDKALATLRHHWNTWITESDFAAIADAGLNHVRLPIGYWAFDVSAGEPYIQGQLPYLLQAVQWAQNHGLKLIIDLHGTSAPGSQNGFDNSGQKMKYPQWHTQQAYVDRTKAVIETLASMFKDSTGTVPVIAPLNEPAGFFGQDILNVTEQYWYDSYDIIRYPYGSESRESNTVVMIHDAFQSAAYWKDFMPSPECDGVILDTHVYQMFSTPENQRSYAEHIQAACAKSSDLTSESLWTVVGEWTPAANDCAKYLNGRGIGSRYDGSYPGSTRVGSCTGLSGEASTFDSNYKTFLRQYWEAQVISYEKAQGWIQWTWKAEKADDWSYQAGLTNGWIPRDPTDLQYRNICG
ncbi:hypothetical protein CVT25_000331 [Psilocybe cyanescens]|uniref:Glycoside hydrolase family 5 domain-containing protein n=1 Tax=Psilocybe cyanescens TaxID=93625 RepID=A0A409VNX2_PSICY|nr:hypothetical protein CVT25_000331 [Psilocybe cyanescens]